MMPNPNGSNDSMDKVDEIHTILSRYTEDLRKELAARDLRIENLQREFSTMAARAQSAEKAATEAQSWLTRISRALNESGFVRGTYEESVKSLILDAKKVPELTKRLAEAHAAPRVLVERTLYDVSQEAVRELRAERNAAVSLLREHSDAYANYADVTTRIKKYLEDGVTDEEG